MLDIRNKKITVIGAQKSGVALVELIKAQGGIPRLSEQTLENHMSREIIGWIKSENVESEWGGHTKKFVCDCDCMVFSPGVSMEAEPIFWAQNECIPALGEIEFAYQFCQKPIIAVTGSNGKTTVVHLIRDIINFSGKKAVLCGNVGFPFSKAMLKLQEEDYIVCEVSSFQMQCLLQKDSSSLKKANSLGSQLKRFKPFVALFLNFSENHLDRHKNMEEYFCAKARISSNQTERDHLVLNYGNEKIRGLATSTKAQVSFFNEKLNGSRSGNPNYSAVKKVADILGIDKDVCNSVFSQFKGIEHRLEWVRNVEGIDFINDSKATTAEAGGWAIDHIEKPIVMICGGRDKNIDFSVLAERVKNRVKKLIVYGEASEKIKRTFENIVTVDESSDFDNAVKKARDAAVKGDCVLLSPMCASFDMFENFEQRGKVFKEIVARLT